MGILANSTLALLALCLGLITTQNSAHAAVSRKLDPAQIEALGSTARESLAANVVSLPSGPYLTAGAHQFKSLWTRDFCFATRGLLHMRMDDTIRNHLELIIGYRRKMDQLVPKVLDSTMPQYRVIATVFKKISNNPGFDIPLKDPLLPSYVDEHNSMAIDSNLLVLLAAHDYYQVTGDHAWWKKQLPALAEIYRHYDSRRDERDGLIIQPAYSDWQDSVKRTGKTFYTNLLYVLVSDRLKRFPEFGINANSLDGIRYVIDQKFFDPEWGIYRGLEIKKGEISHYSLDANLLALDLGYFRHPDKAQELYENLKKSPLWRAPAGVPGLATFPEYPANWVSYTVKLANLRHYHDSMYWTWLMGLSAKTAWKMGDIEESTRIFEALVRTTQRDQTVGEIFTPTAELKPFESWLYDSETPFSWGAAFILDAVETVQGSPLRRRIP